MLHFADGTSGKADEEVDSPAPQLDQRLRGDFPAMGEFAKELTRLRERSADEFQLWGRPMGEHDEAGRPTPTSGRINADPATVEQGLAKLVLTLIEFLRRLMERQAMRRMEAGSLTDDEIERMGETFLKLEQRMDELKAAFGLQDEDLNLSLGPIGDLLPEEERQRAQPAEQYGKVRADEAWKEG